MKNNKKYIIR